MCPRAEIPTEDDGPDQHACERMKGQFPKGAYGDHVIERAGKMLSQSGKEEEVTSPKMSDSMRSAMKRGLVSEKAAKGAMGKGMRQHGGKEAGSRSANREGKEPGSGSKQSGSVMAAGGAKEPGTKLKHSGSLMPAGDAKRYGTRGTPHPKHEAGSRRDYPEAKEHGSR